MSTSPTLRDSRSPAKDDPYSSIPASIVPASGALSTVQARVSPLFGHVIENVSTLTSRSKQVTLSLSPELSGISDWFFGINYTLADTRARESGFDGATFGTPVAREWARGDLDVRHQLLLQGGYTFKRVALTFFGRLQSGLPFTPMVGGDVNGDGLANDRAFIFNPATSTDASLASATRTLLPNSSRSVRDCLTRQMDRAAGRNSCEGPWTTSLNAQLSYSGKLPITNQYGSISLAVSNPLGGPRSVAARRQPSARMGNTGISGSRSLQADRVRPWQLIDSATRSIRDSGILGRATRCCEFRSVCPSMFRSASAARCRSRSSTDGSNQGATGARDLGFQWRS